MNILIADDMEDSRVLLETILASQGYKVYSARNGAEALEMAMTSNPDMIISDIMMPEMDGFELCRTVKNDDRLRAVPFIFYTATFVESGDERLAMALGASGFITKPIDPEDFLKAICKVLEEQREVKHAMPNAASIAGTTIGHLHNERLMKKLDDKVRQVEEGRKVLREYEERFRLISDERDKIWKFIVGREFTLDEARRENEKLKEKIRELEG